MTFDLNKLRTFYTVVKCGGLSRSEDILGIKVSSISAQLSSLEKEVGAVLLTRNKSGIKLTQSGCKLFSLLKTSLPNIDRIHETIGSNDKDLEGNLTISTWMGIGIYLITECIMGFMKKNPKLVINVIGDNAEIDFNTYEYDAAIREFIPNRDDLVQKELISYSHKLYASQKYLDQHGTPKTPKDLDNHRLISTSLKPDGKYKMVDWHLLAGMPKGTFRAPHLVINSTAGVEKMLKEDLGIGTIAPFYDSVVNNELVEILLDYEKPKLTFYYIYPKSMDDFPKIKLFGDSLLQEIQDKNISF